MTQQLKIQKKAIERRGGVSLWKQIAEEIKGSLSRWRVGEGEQIPTEHELSKVFAVNRHTVRRAIAQLVSEGVLRADQGKGTFVAKAPTAKTEEPQFQFTDNGTGQNLKLRERTLNVRSISASAGLAIQFDVAEGTELIEVEQLGFSSTTPVMLTTSWFVKEAFPALEDYLARSTSLSKFLSKHGHPDYAARETRVSADLCSASQANLLETEDGSPLLVLYSLEVSVDGTPLQVSRSYVSADHLHLTLSA
ncbi:phosphonate metabolism transcriptional regulator PhnF [Rhodobacteraceae bacterium RKSG542]|uniref:phosphonate metabolism transcriptional regulator PhnF n=1 Tax=Pseudovibrio flavus TaxID=2529854 RepID=UPI0012BD6EED|nr:phosphonate metabolism transcriptional regulator PhnF [Pseudovibrio flavus]MTI16874.1 phosphonate metabolism transcriptional regulator PhnF [Pseudovibrio flavus]